MSIPWEAADVTTIATTALNSLAAGASSGPLTEVDNATGLYTHGLLDLELGASFTCGTGTPRVDCYATYAPDGTNYPNPPSGTGAIPGDLWVTRILGIASAGFTRNHSGMFPLVPFKKKIVIVNNLHTTGNWNSTGNVLKLYRFRLDVTA